MSSAQRPAENPRAELIKEVLALIVGVVGIGVMGLALFNAIWWVLLFVAGAMVVTLALLVVARPIGNDNPGVDEPN